MNKEEIEFLRGFNVIEGYKNYSISKNGQVYSFFSNKFLKPIKSKGYLKVNLYKNKKFKIIPIHRLVLQSFNPQGNKGLQINHKDGNKENNCLINLEWCTSKQNNIHAWKNGLNRITPKHRKITSELGKAKRKFSMIEVELIKKEYKEEPKNSTYKLAKKYGVHQSTIWRLLKNITYGK